MCDAFKSITCNPIRANFTFCYDFNSSETVTNTFDGAETDNSFVTSVRNYTDCKNNVVGSISFQTARVTNTSGSFLNEVVNFISGESVLIARSFYADSGTGGESGADFAWYKVLDATGAYSGIKMVYIQFNADGTRVVAFYKNVCGKFGGEACTQLNSCNQLGFIKA